MRKILAAIAALFGAMVLLVATPSPAHAVGWSGQRCDDTVEGVVACIQVHTVTYGGAYKVDAVQLCMGMWKANNHVRGIVRNGIVFPGTWRYGIPDVAKGGGCSYAYPNYVMSNGCYTASGDVDLAVWPDNDHWKVTGRILGGAC
jgi:hypothetical protein